MKIVMYQAELNVQQLTLIPLWGSELGKKREILLSGSLSVYLLYFDLFFFSSFVFVFSLFPFVTHSLFPFSGGPNTHVHSSIPYTLLDVRCWLTNSDNIRGFFLPILRKIIEACHTSIPTTSQLGKERNRERE